VLSDTGPATTAPKTSGLAIASVILSTIGIVPCFCVFFISLLGIVFGAVALPVIRRGEARGRGLAWVGIILGIVGIVLGISFWTIVYFSPSVSPVDGTEVSSRDVNTLRELGVLEADEPIELFYSDGFISITEGGAIITDRRLITYYPGPKIEACALGDIRMIDYTPAESWWEEGRLVITQENGDIITFMVSGTQAGDKLFHSILQQRVTEAREDLGRPVPQSVTAPSG